MEPCYKCIKCPSNTIILPQHRISNHATVHLNKSRYELEGKPKCDICFLSFTTIGVLRKHRKYVHQKDPLTDNFKMNKDGQTYSCKLCKHDEICEQARRHHLTLHSKQEEYKEFNIKCDYCGLFLKTRDALNKHKRRNHPIAYAKKSVEKK